MVATLGVDISGTPYSRISGHGSTVKDIFETLLLFECGQPVRLLEGERGRPKRTGDINLRSLEGNGRLGRKKAEKTDKGKTSCIP